MQTTRCKVTLFFDNQCMDVEVYLDLSRSIDLQIERLYGDLVQDYTYIEITPYTDVSDNQLFSMYNRSNDYKSKAIMKRELTNRGYFQ